MLILNSNIEKQIYKNLIELLLKYENTSWIYNAFSKEGIFLGSKSNIRNREIFLELLIEAEKKFVGNESFFHIIVNSFMKRNMGKEFLRDPLVLNFLELLKKIDYNYWISEDETEWKFSGIEFSSLDHSPEDYLDKEDGKVYENGEEDEEDEEDVNDLSHIPESEREVSIQPAQHSIFELHRKYERGDLIIQPFYQRKDVWKKPKKTKLIESVLRKIPIPSLYFAEKQDGRWEVVDGQQRLRAFFDFLNDDFQLSQMPVLHDLKGKKFTKLSPIYQRKIEDYQLHVFLIKKDSHPDIRFDIFERINEGATPLNAQELRNSMYRGGEITYIKKLAKNKHFIRLTKGKLQTTRLKDQEAVLRFLAFYINGYDDYNGNLNSFLNKTLDDFESYKRNLGKIEQDFDETMKLIYSTLGPEAFIKDGSKVIHMSLFDTLSFTFNKYKKELKIRDLNILKDIISNLINNNTEFKKSISSNTLTKKNVRTRFNLIEIEVKKFLNGGD